MAEEQAHSGWVQADRSVEPRPDASFLADLIPDGSAPVDCSAGPSADGWVPAGYSVEPWPDVSFLADLVPDGSAPADCSTGLWADDWAQLDWVLADYSTQAARDERRCSRDARSGC